MKEYALILAVVILMLAGFLVFGMPLVLRDIGYILHYWGLS